MTPRFKEILLATSNEGKVKRARKLIKVVGIDTILHKPDDLGLEVIDVPEEGTMEENSEQKARAYLGKVNMPVIGTDTALYIDGEEIDPLKPKRNALDGRDESEFTKEEIVQKMVTFWQGIAKKHGSEVNGYWRDMFVLVLPDGTIEKVENRRDIILTDTIHGEVDPSLPIRALYRSKTTGIPVQLQTPEEEIVELRPVTEAYKKLLLK